jgi:hypothetical protein
MSEAELQSAIHDAEQYAAEDALFHKGQEAQGKIQTLILRVENVEREAVKNKDKERLGKCWLWVHFIDNFSLKSFFQSSQILHYRTQERNI